MSETWDDRLDPDVFTKLWGDADDSDSPGDMCCRRIVLCKDHPWNLRHMVATLHARINALLAENRLLKSDLELLVRLLAENVPLFLIPAEIRNHTFPLTAREVERVRALEKVASSVNGWRIVSGEGFDVADRERAIAELATAYDAFSALPAEGGER